MIRFELIAEIICWAGDRPALDKEVGANVYWVEKWTKLEIFEILENKDGLVHCLCYYANNLAEGFEILQRLEKAVRPLGFCRVEIERKNVKQYLHETALRLDSTIRTAIIMLKSGRNRQPSRKEADVRRLLQSALE